MLNQILIGIAGCLIGFLIVWKANLFSSFFGEFEWSNKLFGEGYQDTATKFIGLMIILISFLIMTGLIQDIIFSFFGPMVGR